MRAKSEFEFLSLYDATFATFRHFCIACMNCNRFRDLELDSEGEHDERAKLSASRERIKPQGLRSSGLSVLLHSALERGWETLSLVFGHSNDSTFDARFVSAAPLTQSNTRRVACSITHFRCTSAYGRLGGLGDASAKIGVPNISIPYLTSNWSSACPRLTTPPKGKN